MLASVAASLPRSPGRSWYEVLSYLLSREANLTVFLEGPDINHLKRAMRPMGMGKKLDVLLGRTGFGKGEIVKEAMT